MTGIAMSGDDESDLARGGFVPGKVGVAYLHAGEVVMSAEQVPRPPANEASEEER